MGYCFSESGSAGVVSPTPNPWRDSGENLEPLKAGEGIDILVGLRDIIREWPREKTAILRSEARHRRFIMAVAGYPDIDVATRPFDSPLHKRSTEALNVSMMLDNVVGMDKYTSLRSSLLNRDLALRLSTKDDSFEEYLGELKKAHKECLLLLFARLRELDGIDISHPYYRPEEEGLLASLHSYDITRRTHWWPELGKIASREGDFSVVIGRVVKDPGDRPTIPKFKKKVEKGEMVLAELGKAELIALCKGHGLETDGEKADLVTRLESILEEFKKWSDAKELEARHTRLEESHIPESFSFPDTQELVPMSFQFHYVQRWLREYFPEQEGLDGTAQRFLRGTSIMLELIVSEARHRIAREVGIGSITADGGGRVSFLCPRGKMEDRMRGLLEEATWQFLLVNRRGEGSAASNNIRFESTINRWAEACFAAGHEREVRFSEMTVRELREILRGRRLKVTGNKPDLIERLGGDRWRRGDAEEWFRQTQSKLPAFSITSNQGGEDEDADLHSRLNQRMKNGYPKVVKGKSHLNPQKDCMFCCKLEKIPNPGSIDEQMGVNDSLDRVSENVCPAHRLLYFLGHDQRLKDSVLRVPPQEGGLEHLPDPGGQRQVNAVARVDGNSLGILFTERHEKGLEDERLQDRRRRRSFRFNAHWWNSLRSAVDHTGTGDLVAAWVTAGDDVILAEYGPVEKEEDYESMTVIQLRKLLKQAEKPVSGKKTDLIKRLKRGSRLRKTLELWAEELKAFDEELDEGMGLSFGAGLAVKRPSGDRISPQLRRSEHYEKTAKNRWKTMMEGRENPRETHPMLTRLEDGKRVEIDWTRDPKWELCILGKTDSIVVEEEGKPLHVPEDRESVHPKFLEWTEELIERIAQENDLNQDPKEMWGVLKRHYIEEDNNTGEKTLRVLIPFQIGKILVPVGGSRGNIIQACKLEGVTELRLLLTESLFPNEESVERLLKSLVELGFLKPVSAGFIDGPDEGPAGCRDSILRDEKNSDYQPDTIFVTATTNLIIATLSHTYPDSSLVSMRGVEILLDNDLISVVDHIDAESYLAVHGMEVSNNRLILDGILLEAPALADWGMAGYKMFLTWKNKGEGGPKDHQLISSSILKVVQSVGIGAFDFYAFGYGGQMANSTDPNIVKTIDSRGEE